MWMILSIVIRRFSATAWITLRLIEIYGESLLGCGQSYLLLIITIVWTFGLKRVYLSNLYRAKLLVLLVTSRDHWLQLGVRGVLNTETSLLVLFLASQSISSWLLLDCGRWREGLGVKAAAHDDFTGELILVLLHHLDIGVFYGNVILFQVDGQVFLAVRMFHINLRRGDCGLLGTQRYFHGLVLR